MAFDGQRKVVRLHPASVVADPDEAEAAARRRDFDTPRAGIDRVLDQLLHHARRALHHLARGDAVHQVWRQLAYRHGAVRITFRSNIGA